MKIEPPISALVDRCQTVCVPECCGIDAYDFSPIHIASHLIMWRGVPDENELETLRGQLTTLKKRAAFKDITIEEMNQKFTSGQVDEWVEEISANIEIALELINAKREYQKAPRVTLRGFGGEDCA